MKLTNLTLIVIHIILAFVLYSIPLSAKVYGTFLILFVFIISFMRFHPNVLLYTAAYVTGAEVLTRMSRGLFFYESHKYLVMILALSYIFRKGLKKESLIFVVYLLMLVPGIVYSMFIESNDPSFLIESLRKSVLFNIAGPIALGLASMAWIKEKLDLDEFKQLIFWMFLPIVTTTFYIILKTPTLREIVFTTSANFATSGGFGPNQVATVLGLGMFASFVLLLTEKNVLYKSVYLFFLALISYRAFLTFSRGGTITGIFMILIFIFISWRSDYRFMRTKSFIGIGISALILSVSFLLVMEMTGGIVWNRFTGKDIHGKVKKDVTSGRVKIFKAELESFFSNPFLGSGVGRSKISRKEKIDFRGATHNEISRLLSEHGIFGLVALFILLVAPFMSGAIRKNNLFFYPFFAFWILTIFHSSMRLVAPAALYAFSMLILQIRGKDY